ncbi:MAG: amidohydrolase family protein [Gemmatimonadetes bacterium]|nr:amidohydrolase family protein [Gemmatimonadota bacterium]
MTTPPIRDGGVLVEDGVIRAVGPAAVLESAAALEPAAVLESAARVVRLDDCVLLPGLVNTHAHPELTVFRGLLEDRAFPQWIAALLALKRAAALDEDDYRLSSTWGCIEAARAGVTTVGATEDSDAALHALLALGLRGIVYREVFAPDPAAAADAAASVATKLATMRELESELVRVAISPHAPYSVCDELYRAVTELAAEHGLPVACHAAESAAETELVRDGSGPFATSLRARGIDVRPRGRSTIALLDRLGVLALRPLLVHCVQVDGADIERIRETGAAVAHCPLANARLGHGVAPLPRLLAAGVRVGLGSDSVASNNRVDMLEEARFSSLAQRAISGEPDVLPAAQLLELVTLGGARSLGLEGKVGSLEPGKDADLCAVSLAGAHTRPVHDPVAALFHSARASDVVLTVVKGRTVFEAGRVLNVREEELGRKVDELAKRIASALGG